MPIAPAAPPVRAVLFDLGGVILSIDFGRALAAWAPHSRLAPERLRAAFQWDEPFLQHETGKLSNDGYFAHVRQALELDCDAATVEAGFNAILVAEIEETTHLVEQLRKRVPCYAISNTNDAHMAEMRRAFPGLLPRFDRVFASHEMGHRKPQPAAFEHVLRAIGVPAGEVLLFDDLPANIEGAQALGLQAVLVRGPEDVREALAQRGLLDGESAAA
ncbi:MAG: haloacid dehalogenase-like hydrolase [Ramlibacter sp.]|jgi:putative hydrolase of the HAD superfamily|nr:haloacid dehalogenase-like hydrolase [Ramlibacter sp.]